MSRRGCPESGGQSTVEFALVLPVVLVTILGLVQIGAIVVERLDVVHLCRVAARAAAVSADPDAAARVAIRRFDPDDRTEVVVSSSTDTVTVTIRRHFRTSIALIGDLVPDVTIDETLTMMSDP